MVYLAARLCRGQRAPRKQFLIDTVALMHCSSSCRAGAVRGRRSG